LASRFGSFRAVIMMTGMLLSRAASARFEIDPAHARHVNVGDHAATDVSPALGKEFFSRCKPTRRIPTQKATQ
jgi:hypothetical protein